MGIDVWALIALVVVATAYLLPILVGRREVLGHARAQDRYSARLRLLATAPPNTLPAPDHGERAQIFRRRPEVRAMNRPAVRNVRALRVERELARARRAHEAGRAQRAQAASHRAVVACVLLGVLLGCLAVGLLTVVPTWPSVIPAALLGASMAAGRHASVRGAAADRRERLRIEDLLHEFEQVTGSTAPRAVAADRTEVAREAAVARAAEAPEAAAAESVEAVEPAAVEAAPVVAEVVPAQAVPVEAASPALVEEAVPVARAVAEEAPAVAPVAAPVPRPAAVVVAEREPVKVATPPQAWHPVAVPAPTYTLVAPAPRRAVEEWQEEERPSAPVPVRPTAVRTYVTTPETPRQPIDLDAVLQRRRAAGA